MTERLASQEHWDQVWAGQFTYNPDALVFKDIFLKYVQPGMRCFEVGCCPGRYMIYLAREFQCQVSGIDYSEQFEPMKTLFEQCQVIPSGLYNEDFLTFQSREQVDFVYSLGFLEHFTDFEQVIVKHIQLVRENGLLFLACPNYRSFVRRPIHYLFDREDFKRHYLPAMDLKRWNHILSQNGMTVLEQGYSGTARLWFSPSKTRPRFVAYFLAQVAHLSRAIDRRVNWPNRWTSPYLVSISMKQSK